LPHNPQTTQSPRHVEHEALDWRAKARLAAEAALSVKAEDVVLLEVGEIAFFADAFILATGRSDRQVQAIADAVVRAAKDAGDPPLGMEGYRDGRWVLVDLGDVIVHVFQREVREHYDLERLWSEARRVELGEPQA
jgi:ribosome-associated protein